MADDLLDGLRRGEPAAYRQAVRLHGPPVYAFLLRLTGTPDLAEDLFQETWLSLARHATRLREDTHLGAWLFSVARNAYRSHRRWRWVDPSRWFIAEPDVDVTSDEPTPERAASAAQEIRAIDRALARLPPKDREILLLTSVEGLAPAEVAAMLNVNQETLRQRLARARKALAEELETEGLGDENAR